MTVARLTAVTLDFYLEMGASQVSIKVSALVIFISVDAYVGQINAHVNDNQ